MRASSKLSRRRTWPTAVAATTAVVMLGAAAIHTGARAEDAPADRPIHSAAPRQADNGKVNPATDHGDVPDAVKNESAKNAFPLTVPSEPIPMRTEQQHLDHLPDGVSIHHVDWLTDRRVALYINSRAMPGDNPIKVEILLARDWHSQPDKKFPTVLGLDGMVPNQIENGWTAATNIVQQFADRNVNVVLPVGGLASFYTDWLNEDSGQFYKWETFLTQDLPPILKEGWRANDKTAVFGMSAGGTGAMNLAERHPDLFNFVASYSGYLDTSSPGMSEGIGLVMKNVSPYNAENMWGPYGSDGWKQHDPKLNVGTLKNTGIYVSAGSGAAGSYDDDNRLVPQLPKKGLTFGQEALARMTAETFVNYANRAGINVTTAFRNSGTHTWPYWQFELGKSWPYMADSLGLSSTDRGSNCVPMGEIANAALKDQAKLGGCTSDEYASANGGKIQDFRNGRTFWSPSTGAHNLWGRIGAHYAEMGGPNSFLGYPTSEEIPSPDGKGRFVKFEHGAIYWNPDTGPHAVDPEMLDAWGTVGYETGKLGYPIADAKSVGGGTVQEFHNGILTRAKDGHGHVIQGDIAKKYKDYGGVDKLGWAKSHEKPVNGGAFSEFDKGYIYWSPDTGAHVIMKGDIYDTWVRNGAQDGKYGFPTSDMATIPAGGLTIDFQHGTVKEMNGKVQEP
ncbi:alpha/beta hydrolase-fold protein [Corynebacterium kroppenstedtii]|uniref:alpha/beta hydrolase-fold protein n=1 Tax=Corynebacterium sp. PCR 32 TaxID=3351342 RepID=UPI0030AD7995